MAKLATGIKVWSVGEWEQRHSSYTRFHVRGLSPQIYTVLVDSEGLWTCNCKSHKFNDGLCYHILMLKTEREWVSISQKLNKIVPAVVNHRDFADYFEQPRFVAEPLYEGPRSFLIVARHIYLGKVRQNVWAAGDQHVRFAGTVLEGLWDRYGCARGEKIFRVCDCIFYRGLDYRRSPLAVRRELLESVLNKWRPPGIALSEYAASNSDKRALMKKYGCCILKDVASVYDLTDQSPRAWLIRGRK